MIDADYCQMMAAYNQWMNQKLYLICSEMADDERKHDRGAFFKSIHGTLNHLLVADRIWMGRFTGNPLVGVSVDQELHSDFNELHRERQQLDQTILSWAAGLSTDWLKQTFTYTSGLDKQTRSIPTWILVTHMFNHQTHHRGQLTTLLTQMKYDPGVTDLPWLPGLSDLMK